MATHPDDLSTTYSMSGADAALFAIDAETGQIRVSEGTALDFEAERSTYTINVTATDTSETGALITVTIEVTDIDHGHYDLDDNERIERGEVIASISDYFKSIIGKDEVIQLIACTLLASGGCAVTAQSWVPPSRWPSFTARLRTRRRHSRTASPTCCPRGRGSTLPAWDRRSACTWDRGAIGVAPLQSQA